MRGALMSLCSLWMSPNPADGSGRTYFNRRIKVDLHFLPCVVGGLREHVEWLRKLNGAFGGLSGGPIMRGGSLADDFHRGGETTIAIEMDANDHDILIGLREYERIRLPMND